MSNILSKAERHANKACELDAFKSIKLDDLKEKVTQMLAHIGDGGIFDQYTKHDISHINKMLDSLDYIIPQETQDKMTGADWMLIVTATYFHDLGMLVTRNEYENRNSSGEYKTFKQAYLDKEENTVSLSLLSADDQERFIYQEFVRHHHGDRIASWIRNEDNAWCYTDTNVLEIVASMISGFRPMFKDDLATICESHNLDDLDDFDKYKVEKAYGTSPQEKGNVFYAALIVRTADLLHITSDRTPSIEYAVISPTNPISQEEWAKQNAVSSVSPKIAEDQDGNKNDALPKDTFEVSAFFEKEDGFFSLIEYLKYAREELKNNHRLNEIAKKKYASKYDYPWKDIDDSTIQAKNFERRQLSLTIDQQKILSLLVGETLYNNLSISLRELAQNAIDAVKVKLYELQEEHKADGYTPRVDVYWDATNRELMVCDNGTGMNMDIIENHLLKVGSSRYQDAEFQKKHPNYNSISRFGIGLLTCFLIADDVDILTQMDEKEKPLLLKIRNVHGKYLLKHGAEKNSNLKITSKTGTSIKLKVRPSVKKFEPEQILATWILIPNCEFYYHEAGSDKQIGYLSPKHLLESVLKAKGISLADTKYKIKDYNNNGIELAILLSYNSFMKEYSMVEANNMWLDQKDTVVTPWGTSIEGIRIDENTPGYNGHPFVAYANMTGKEAPKTNVARSNVNSSSVSKMLEAIYGLYLNNIESQQKDLQKDFSVTWVAEEMTWLLNAFLLRQDQYNRTDFSDREILKDKLSESEILLIEQEDKRKFCSLKDLEKKGHFWTMESEAFAAANRLLKEIKSTDKSAISLLKTLYGEEQAHLKDIDMLLCKQKYYNLMDDLILSKFEISKISINEEQRRLDLYWSLKEKGDKWIVVDTDKRQRRYGMGRNMMFVQTSTEQLFVDNYDAIRSSYGIIVPKSSGLSDFFIDLLSKLNIEDEDDNAILENVASFISDMFTKYREGINYDWKKQIAREFDRESNPSFYSFVFDKISEDDLVNACSNCKFRLYDTSKWYREKTRN